jgi:hypothetical protein
VLRSKGNYQVSPYKAVSTSGQPPAIIHQAIKHRPCGRGQAELMGERLDRIKASKMVRRRAMAAGVATEVCNHTFRGTGITANLENGGTLGKARQMAAHASTHTTQLYDRREDRVTLDEVVKINIHLHQPFGVPAGACRRSYRLASERAGRKVERRDGAHSTSVRAHKRGTPDLHLLPRHNGCGCITTSGVFACAKDVLPPVCHCRLYH